MARTKKAVKDSTAKQTIREKQNNINTNTQEDKKTSLKSHSMTSQTKKEVGRPAINIDLDKLTEFASQPIENYKIAEALGISLTTFYKNMRENTDFREAYNTGIDNRKYELEKALFRRATGFEATEIVTEKDEEGNIIKKKITDKSYVPDTTAAIFALKNVYSDKYKDRIETVTDINVNINQMQQLSNEELAKLVSSNVIDAEYSIE